MRAYAAFAVGIVAVASLIGATMAEMAARQPSDESDAPALDARVDLPVAQQAIPIDPAAAEAELRRPEDLHARGLRLGPDGSLRGRVDIVDPNTFELIPLANAQLSFMQQRRVVSQTVTGLDGAFVAEGLSPLGLYSLFVSSDNWVCMTAIVTRRRDPGAAPQRPLPPLEAAAAPANNRNQIRLVTTNLALLQDDEGLVEEEPVEQDEENGEAPAQDTDDEFAEDEFADEEIVQLQPIPREDFIAGLRQGLLGIEPSGTRGPPLGAAGGGQGGAGGGGGGGAGAGLGIIGAGLGAAAAHLGDDDGELASPFTP